MNDRPFSNKKVLLGITGSMAAYKACELVRRLKDGGAEIKVVMTQNALKFLGETTLLSLSGNKVVTDTFASGEEWVADHISLTRWADVVLIAPATANIIGKVSSGIANDILSTTILSARCKVVFAPAMNSAMYENAIVQENIARLRRLGYEFVEPEAGFLACGEEGIGRLADTNMIVEKLKAVLQQTS